MTKLTIRILMIEDSESDALLLEENLNQDTLNSFEFTICERLESGLETLREHGFDLILLDLGLPDSQGLGTFEKLHAAFSDMPVIVLSGLMDERLALEAVQSGAQDYLVKGPTSWEIAPRAIRYAIERNRTEEQLRASEERYRDLVENIQDLICTHDLQGNLLFVNQAPARLLGYTPEELIGTNLRNLLVPKVRDQFDAYLSSIQQDGSASGFMQVLTKNGEMRLWEYNNNLRTAGIDKPIVHGMARDVTERQQAKTALRQSEERYRLLFEKAPVGILSATIEGQITEVNTAALQILGSPSVEATKKINLLTFPPLIEAGISADFQNCIENGHPVSAEHPYTTMWGKSIFVKYQLTPTLNAAGEIILIQAMIEDITERKEAEAALLESFGRFRTLFEASPDAVMLIDPQGDWSILDCNTAACEMNGYTREELIGQSIDILNLEPGDEAEHHKYLAEIQRVGVLRMESFHRHKDGSIFPIELSTCMITLGGQSVVLGIDRDITERKRAEQALLESEEHYRALFEHLPIPAFTKDRQGKYTSSNAENQRYWKISPIGRTDVELLSLEEAEVLRKNDQYVMETGNPLTKEELFKNTPLGERRILTRKVPIRDGGGSIVGILGASIDITERKQAEEELRKSEERFAKAFRASPDGLVISRIASGEILEANNGFLEIFGIARAEAIGKNPLLLNMFADPQDRQDAVKILQERGTVRDFELVIRRKSGEARQAIVSIEKIELSGELCMLTIVRDVTAQKQAEEKLNQSENRYRLATKATNDIIWEWDAKTNQLIWTENAQVVFGYSPEEIGLDEKWWDAHIHPDDRERVLLKLDTLLAGDRSIWLEEYRFLLKDGSYAYISDHAYVERDAEGEPLRMIGAMSDITERKRAEEKLRESEKKYRDLINAMNDTVWVIDFDTAILDVNNAAVNMLGYTREELLSMKIPDIDSELKPEQIRGLAGNMPKDKVQIFETWHKTKDGRKLPVEVSSSLVSYMGKTVIMSIARDITERKRAEQAIRLSEKKFKTLFEIAPVGISVLDQEHNIVDANFALERITGLGRDKLLSGDHRKRTYLRPDGTVMPTDELASSLVIKESMPIFDVETGIVTEDRGVIWTQVSAAPLDMPDASMVVITQDISERKQSEQALRHRLAELETLYESGLSLNQSLEPKNIGQNIIDVLAEKLDWNHTTIRLYHSESDALELLAYNIAGKTTEEEWQEIGEKFRTMIAQSGDGLSGWVVQHGETVRCGDVVHDPRYVETVPGLNSGLYVPIQAGERTIGVISVESEKPDYFTAEDEHLAVTLAAQAAVAFENIRLFKDLLKSNDDLFRAYDETIEGWSHALDLRDKETEGHTQRVTTLTEELARLMGIPKEQMIHIHRGSLLHDIGKMGVPDRILLKPDKLTDDEWIIMREHPVHAYNLLSKIEFLKPALNIPHYHHEKWDGSGYPEGLQREQIPLEARIFAVVDVFDALISDRPYRPGWPRNKAIQYIPENSGSHFDPKVVDVFLKLIKEK